MKALRAILKRVGFGRTKIRRQMHMVYAVALLIPLSIAGLILLYHADKLLNDHYIELLESDNRRIKTLLTEMTTQAYRYSEDICADNMLKKILTDDYASSIDFVVAANAYSDLDSLIYSASEIQGIYIYTDNPTVKNYKQIQVVTEEIAQTDWYQEAMQRAQAFWTSIDSGKTQFTDNLALVRRITLTDSNYTAVLVLRLSDSYIHSRIDSSSIVDVVSLDNEGIVYSSKKGWYGRNDLVAIDYENALYKDSGTLEVEGTKYFATISTSSLYMTNSKMYICTLDNSSFKDIDNITRTWSLILVIAILVPGIILGVFANYFSSRVALLRAEMHKARLQDYNMISEFKGHDELTEAFEDLKFMVQDIKEKEAKMYEAELNEKELLNKQQIMEYKMLASQINPHYLYNTLETIRMKALTSGNKEVADSIKILGKTLHYVLENTGTSSTTLQKELNHVENYLSIQKLRFGERINYKMEIQDGLNTEEYSILPLLLQPIVENAVVHGLENINGVGMVTISVAIVGEEQLQISINDSGTGMTESELEKLRTMLNTPELNPQSSVALYNINQRIHLCYGEAFGMEIESEYGKGTRVILNLPGFLPENF